MISDKQPKLDVLSGARICVHIGLCLVFSCTLFIDAGVTWQDFMEKEQQYISSLSGALPFIMFR